MTKNIANYVGIARTSTPGGSGIGNAIGIWDKVIQYYFRKRNTWPDSTLFLATGGNQTPSSGIQPGNGYTYWTFTSPGTFTVTGDTTVELFIVGGGGAGRGCGGGGGGAGAIFYATNVPVTSGPYSITVGTGAVPGPDHSYPYAAGGASSALGYTAAGGGTGGGHTFTDAFVNGQPGGSGGGASFSKNGGGGGYSGGSATGSGGGTPGATSPPAGWGNPGGPSPGNGGGAGASGPGGGGGLVYSNFAGPLIGFPTIPSTFAAGGTAYTNPTYVNPHPSPGTGNGGNGGPYCQGGGAGASGIVVIRKLG